MVTTATCKRLLGFEGGPQGHTFYACEGHRKDLDEANVMCFEWTWPEEPTTNLSEDELDEETSCDLCREG